MSSKTISAALRACLCLAAFGAPAFDPGQPTTWRHAAALAGPASDAAEKEAFEAAKELGTVEAWDAFLSNYSSGFRADLARAYVKKLGETAPSTAAAAPSAQYAAAFNEFPTVAGSWGGIVRDGPGQQYRKLDSLDEGEDITLMARSDVFENGFPWFKIAYRDGQIGFKWGGILCAKGAARPDVFQTCPAETQRRAPPRQTEKKREPEGCSGSKILIDGRCVRKADAATHCGPGYRLNGNTCVQGYQEPKPQKQRPSWQNEAIKHGCKPGMGWNKQEGCHEND